MVRSGTRSGLPLLVATAGALGVLLFSGLAHPLFWSDEADTAMFARRIIEFGYPKVHDGRNVVYQFGSNIALGVDERSDAYIGTTWGQFYFAAPGVRWAEGVADPWAKTARVRLPFALAGALGLALFAAAVWPAWPRGAARSSSARSSSPASASRSRSCCTCARRATTRWSCCWWARWSSCSCASRSSAGSGSRLHGRRDGAAVPALQHLLRRLLQPARGARGRAGTPRAARAAPAAPGAALPSRRC